MATERDITDIRQEIRDIKNILSAVDLRALSQKLDKIIYEQDKQKALISKMESTDFFDIIKTGFFLSLSSKISNIEDKLNQLLKK